jgi:hypothetical protein
VSLAQQDELRRQLALLLGDSYNGIPQNLRSGLVPCREPPCRRRTVQVTIVKLIDSDPRKAPFDWARTVCSSTFALPKRFANHPRPPYPSALSINQAKSAFGVQTPCRKLQTASALVQSGDFPPGSSSQQFPPIYRTWQFHAFPAPLSFYLGIIVPPLWQLVMLTLEYHRKRATLKQSVCPTGAKCSTCLAAMTV